MMTRGASLGVCSICLCLLCSLGCRTASLSDRAAKVAAGRNPPPPDCRSLGYLTGRGGGTFGGAYVTNDSLVEYALNDLRNQAAELGANYVQHDTPQMGSGDGTTTTVTISGTAYKCGNSPAAATREDTAPARGSSEDAKKPAKVEDSGPLGVAAFRFGSTLKEAQLACTDANLDWSRKGDDYECSAMPWSVGVVGTVQVSFCNNKLCHVELVTPEDPTGKQPLRDVLKLRELLVDKYKRPTENRQSLPGACATSAAPCLVDGTATLEYIWKFPADKSIRLFAEKTATGVRARLVYDQAVDAAKTAL